jgi:hypothetical protein
MSQRRGRELRPGIVTVAPTNPTLSIVNNRLTVNPGGSSVTLPGAVTPSLTLSNNVLTLQPGGSSVLLPNVTTLSLVSLNTAVPQTLTSASFGKYHLCSGGNQSITLPGSNAPVGTFMAFKNLTSDAIGYTNLAGASNTASNTQVILNTTNGWIVL